MFQYFYHERLRKSVAIFGTLFNNIHVLRKNSTGQVISQVKVPLSYAPKEKYLERVRENPSLTEDTKVAIKLPRMSFEIVSINYNAERKVPKLNAFSSPLSNTLNNKFFTPAPYDINFQLNVYARQQDDALQIVEQILPYFNPQYTLTINPFKDLAPDLKEDVPITIQSVSFTDDFEGSLEQRRTIIYALDFLMQVNFYGPINSASVIRRAITDIYDQDEGAFTDPKIQQVVVTPNPFSVEPDSDFGFTTNVFEDFSLNLNPGLNIPFKDSDSP